MSDNNRRESQVPNNPILTPIWEPEDARLLAVLAAQHPTYPAEQPGMRPRTLRCRLAFAALGAIVAGGLLGAGVAKADTSSFLQSLGDHGLTVYDSAAAISTGYRICSMLQSANGEQVAQYVFTHTSWSDVPTMDTARAEVLISVEELCPAMDHRGQSASAPQQAPDFGPVRT
jgi:hypothetical protein